MSTTTEHKRRQAARRWRHLRRAGEWWTAIRVIVRRLLWPILAFGGLYLAVDELKRSPLHHNTIIWVVGFILAGVGLVGGYKEVRNRVVLRR